MGGYIGSGIGSVANAAERKQTYTITTATTSLTGLAYTPTKVHVFHNGVRLVDGTDYTATNGTSITLTNAAQNGDEVVVISYPSFQTSDTVSAANGGTFAGNVTMSSDLNVDTIKNTSGTAAMSIDSSGIVNLSNTVMYDTYRLTSDFTSDGTMTAWEKPDDPLCVSVGDSMSVSSGIFTFPRTGVYRVAFYAMIDNAASDGLTAVELQGTVDNSSYELIVYVREGGSSDADFGTLYGEAVINISDVSNRKVKLVASSVGTGSHINGHTDENQTYISFQYLAPAQ
jgi:hypothetical protein